MIYEHKHRDESKGICNGKLIKKQLPDGTYYRCVLCGRWFKEDEI